MTQSGDRHLLLAHHLKTDLCGCESQKEQTGGAGKKVIHRLACPSRDIAEIRVPSGCNVAKEGKMSAEALRWIKNGAHDISESLLLDSREGFAWFQAGSQSASQSPSVCQRKVDTAALRRNVVGIRALG